jgi:hypothetical protein
MMQFPKLDQVMKRQRQQAWSTLITLALFAGGVVATVSSLAACATGTDPAEDAVAAVVQALDRDDLGTAAPYLTPEFPARALAKFQADLRQAYPGARVSVESSFSRGDELVSRVVVDGTPLPAVRFLLATAHDENGLIRSLRAARADLAPAE